MSEQDEQAEAPPGYADRDNDEETPQTGGAAADTPQGGEHYGEAPLGEQDED